jgi:hypothetical protein
MVADAKLVLGVHQLALRIPFEGVAQRDAVRTLRQFAAATCDYLQLFYSSIKSRLFYTVNRNNMTVDF